MLLMRMKSVGLLAVVSAITACSGCGGDDSSLEPSQMDASPERMRRCPTPTMKPLPTASRCRTRMPMEMRESIRRAHRPTNPLTYQTGGTPSRTGAAITRSTSRRDTDVMPEPIHWQSLRLPDRFARHELPGDGHRLAEQRWPRLDSEQGGTARGAHLPDDLAKQRIGNRPALLDGDHR